MGFWNKVKQGLSKIVEAITDVIAPPEHIEIEVDKIIAKEIARVEEELIEEAEEYELTISRSTISVDRIPYHSVEGDRHYYDAMLYAWSFDETKLNLTDLKEIFFRELEKWLEYDQGEWWFPHPLNIEELAEITDLTEEELAECAETWEFTIEERERVVYHRWGWL